MAFSPFSTLLTSPTGPAGGGLGGTFPNPTFGNGMPFVAGDISLLGANFDPVISQSNSILIAGTVYLIALPVRQPTTITNLLWQMPIAGSGTSTGSFAGLYSPAGTLLSGSADIAATLIGTAGPITTPLSTPQAVTGGPESAWPWAAILVNLSVTQPTLNKGAAIAIANVGLTAANFRFALNGTLRTTLAASITPASNASTNAFTFWCGWS